MKKTPFGEFFFLTRCPCSYIHGTTERKIMKITETDVKVLLDFLPSFDISNSDWGKDFLNRLENTKPEKLTGREKALCDWEETW